MTIERKLLGTSPSGGGPTDVAEVFSTDLYTGNDTDRDIVNGIDLAGEGGLVWIKSRQAAYQHMLVDSEYTLGAAKYGDTSTTSGNTTGPVINTFNSDGFNLDSNWYGNSSDAQYGGKYVAWTFRKKKKFFDIVTYSGNSTSGRTVSHSLGSVPAMMIIKQTNGTNAWFVYHKDFIKDSAAAPNSALFLNLADAGDSNAGYFNNTAPTDSVFTLGNSSGDWGTNGSGENYVAYLFADNSAEDADDQMIKCGSFTGNGSATGPVVDLGWEPQFLITKVGNSSHWNMWDSMRGITAADNDARLYPNLINVEDTSEKLQLTSTGFQIKSSSISINTSGVESIYMAIRAPMMKEPEAATDVFAINTYGSNRNNTLTDAWYANFPVDMAFWTNIGGDDRKLATRLTGEKYLEINGTGAEQANSEYDFDSNTHWHSGGGAGVNSDTDIVSWMWKRAKGFFDVVAYNGNGASSRQITHALSVIPEMIWVKERYGSGTRNWNVYHKDNNGGTTPEGYFLKLNATDAAATTSSWADTAPTDSNFTVSNSSQVNYSSRGYTAFLFATLDGISKVGSFTTTGSDVNVDCGFSNGARFVFIKRTDGNAEWWFWDTLRGITAGNDSRMTLHTNGAAASANNIDPYSTGFTMKTNIIGPSGQNYIFYAIA